MPVRYRVSADSLTDLRLYLRAADVDFGCRPVAVKSGGRFLTEVTAEPGEMARLAEARGTASIRIEVVAAVAPRALETAPVGVGNRFAEAPVRGLAQKE